MSASGERIEERNLRRFDIASSVKMMRYDLDVCGDVKPETYERVGEEELSLLVEGVDRASRTSFTLRRENSDLVYFNNGEWKSYSSLLNIGVQAAESEASNDFRKTFLVEAAYAERRQGNQMRSLEPGQHTTWWSTYDYETEEKFGANFMQKCGFKPHRKMAFLYRATCQEDGNVVLESQTLDRSDQDGFNNIAQALEHNLESSLDELVGIYDATLKNKFGQDFYAGRTDAEKQENAWNEIHKHRDLIEYHINKLTGLAYSSLVGEELERETTKHTIGVWAAFKKRIDGFKSSHTDPNFVYVSHLDNPELNASLESETTEARADAIQRGIPFISCGGEVGAALFDAIFGEGDMFGSLSFTCSNGHVNRRNYGELLETCKDAKCTAVVKC
jgi:hypothetical protein